MTKDFLLVLNSNIISVKCVKQSIQLVIGNCCLQANRCDLHRHPRRTEAAG